MPSRDRQTDRHRRNNIENVVCSIEQLDACHSRQNCASIVWGCASSDSPHLINNCDKRYRAIEGIDLIRIVRGALTSPQAVLLFR